MLRWLLASLHLLALGVGLGAVWVRATALRGPLDSAGVRRVLAADSWWGLAGLLWIVTGLWRLFAGTEKPTHYYMQNHFFYLKMAALLVLLLLEVRAMIILMGWRRSAGRGGTLDAAAAPGLARISYMQVALVLVMLAAAAAMARGMGGGS